jgi:hypothetical protein
MTIALRTADSMIAHAICMAAGLRDGLRTAQFYARDLARADSGGSTPANQPTLLSSAVAGAARLVDWLLNKGAEWSVRLLAPHWRDLPSPFTPGMRAEVLKAIRENRLEMTSLFTAYFFRAARHILDGATVGPNLVLEHRIDAARRLMAAEGIAASPDSPARTLGAALLHLVEADPIVKVGEAKPSHASLTGPDFNLPVMATACLALMLAEEGKPLETLDEDEFFAITSALLAPRLPGLAEAVARRDANALAEHLTAVRNLY